MEVVISKGGKVSENELVRLIELLMNDLLKLDSISADGEAKLQRRMLVSIQTYIVLMNPHQILIFFSLSGYVQCTGSCESGEKNSEVRGDAGRH